MNHTEQLGDDTLFELRDIVARYPFFQSGRLLLLKNLFILHDGAFGKELGKNAIYITDRSILYDMVERTGLEVLSEQHEADDQIDRTLSLIDSFLQSNVSEESSLLPSEPSTDYLSYMEREHGEVMPTANKSERTIALIDQFLSQSDESPLLHFDDVAVEPPPTEDAHKVEQAEKDADDSVYTENLAKILISQKRYSQALEIIKRLYLQNPQKNCYFADQMRFLEKLITNDKNKL